MKLEDKLDAWFSVTEDKRSQLAKEFSVNVTKVKHLSHPFPEEEVNKIPDKAFKKKKKKDEEVLNKVDEIEEKLEKENTDKKEDKKTNKK